jgi:hypothetical protein
VAVRARSFPLVAMFAMLATTQATAQPLELAWQAPATCPDGASVRARIEQRLGRPLDDVLVSVDVETTPDRKFVAHVDLHAVTETNDVRTLTSSRCDDLADAVSLIVARVAKEAEARRAEPVHVAARDEEESLTVASPLPGATRGPRMWSFGIRIGGISGVGVVPEVGIAGEVSGYVRRRDAFVELARAQWIQSTQRVHAGGPAHLDIGLGVTSFRAGWRPQRPLRAWLDVDVGNMDGTGVGLSDSRVGSGRWVAGGAGFGVAWPMTRWARLVGSTEAVFAFERVRFRLDDGAVIYQPAPMAARATVGLEIGWP